MSEKINDYPDYFALVMYEDKQHVRLDICGAILSDISISNSVSGSNMMKILDMCCGSKMFWYEKYEPHTTYMDIRKDTYTTMDRGKERKIEIAPDIQADFTDMPFADNTFDLIIFDPPHLIHAGKNSWLAKKYGVLDPITGIAEVVEGFKEGIRVLKPTGTLLFKWNQDQIPFGEILRNLKNEGFTPILGDKRSKTKWTVFIKPVEIK